MYYIFDGSYYGLLCCVFESFERKEFDVRLTVKENFKRDFFSESRTIYTDCQKAQRVQNALLKKAGKRSSDFYHAYLSEDVKAWQAAMNIMIRIFKTNENMLTDYGNDDILYISQIVKKISRERHRMKAFIRFQKSSNGMYVAVIEPDFNVLPLIAGFFKNRYADQSWLIYDNKRNYGLLYNLDIVSEVRISALNEQDIILAEATITIDDSDGHFQQLWQRYYKSTNIEARENLKLHLQHVPKRYWKYLPEKNVRLNN